MDVFGAGHAHASPCANLASYLHLRWFVDRVGDHTGNYTASIRAKMKSIRDCVDSLLFLIRWVLAHGEIALLRAEDLSIYVRRRHRFHPVNNRSFVNISEQDCYIWFSQDHENMCLLMAHLRVPDTFTHTNRAVYTGEEIRCQRRRRCWNAVLSDN